MEISNGSWTVTAGLLMLKDLGWSCNILHVIFLYQVFWEEWLRDPESRNIRRLVKASDALGKFNKRLWYALNLLVFRDVHVYATTLLDNLGEFPRCVSRKD